MCETEVKICGTEVSVFDMAPPTYFRPHGSITHGYVWRPEAPTCSLSSVPKFAIQPTMLQHYAWHSVSCFQRLASASGSDGAVKNLFSGGKQAAKQMGRQASVQTAKQGGTKCVRLGIYPRLVVCGIKQLALQ